MNPEEERKSLIEEFCRLSDNPVVDLVKIGMQKHHIQVVSLEARIRELETENKSLKKQLKVAEN